MPGRLNYIDALRTFCMIYGLFVHAATTDPSAALSPFIWVTSSHFRMATFFLISGFFSMLLMHRRGILDLYRHRMLVLSLPLMTGLILLNPVTNWLIQKSEMPDLRFINFLFGSSESLPLPVNWHLHLWFLFSLITYVVFLPVFGRLLVFLAGHADRLARRQGDMVVVSIALVSVLAEFSARAVNDIVFSPYFEDTEFEWLFRATLQSAFYFLLGALLFLSRPLFDALHRISLPAIVLVCVLYLALAFLPMPEMARFLGKIAANEFATVVAISSFLHVFRRTLSREYAIVRILNESVYTIYIFHFLIIYAFSVYLVPDVVDPSLRIILLSVAAFLTGLALHWYVIRPTPVLSLLFNGKYQQIETRKAGNTIT